MIETSGFDLLGYISYYAKTVFLEGKKLANFMSSGEKWGSVYAIGRRHLSLIELWYASTITFIIVEIACAFFMWVFSVSGRHIGKCALPENLTTDKPK